MSPVSSLLAFIGTGLTAAAVFAPARPRSATISFAPPVEPPPFERWSPEPPSVDPEPPSGDPDSQRPSAPPWTALVDPRTDGSEITVRLALIDALAALATPWADAILRRAHDEEPDPQVRAAAGAAMREAG